MSEDAMLQTPVLLGRRRRLDKRGILAFLRGVAGDRRGMLELRRLLASELARSSIHNLRDDVVLELLAERYVSGALDLVLVHPAVPEVPGFPLEESAPEPVPTATNKAEDPKPSPIVPYEYPVLARVESDGVVSATLRLVAELAGLLFGSFGHEKRPSTLARAYQLVSGETSGKVAHANAELDITIGLELHAFGPDKPPKPDVPAVFLATANAMKHAPSASASALGHSLFALADVPMENKRSDDERASETTAMISEPRWSESRVEVGQEVSASFTYAGLEAGRVVTLTFLECNADGSRKKIAQQMVQVEGESGEHKLLWKRDPDAAKADVAEDVAEGDSGPVEYRFTVEARKAAPSGESGPLWLTNTVTVTLDDEGGDRPRVVVLKDAEKEIRVKSANGKATFEKVIVGPIAVGVVSPKFTDLKWSSAKVPVGKPVEAEFSYEDAIEGMSVEVLVHEFNADGTSTEVERAEVTLDAESGQAKVSFTRTEDEVQEDTALDESEGDTGPLEYRFVVSDGGAESEPSAALFLTHTVVLKLEDAGDGSPFPDGMELLIVGADGTEHRGALSGGEVTFEGVVCGPMVVKLAPKAGD